MISIQKIEGSMAQNNKRQYNQIKHGKHDELKSMELISNKVFNINICHGDARNFGESWLAERDAITRLRMLSGCDSQNNEYFKLALEILISYSYDKKIVSSLKNMLLNEDTEYLQSRVRLLFDAIERVDENLAFHCNSLKCVLLRFTSLRNDALIVMSRALHQISLKNSWPIQNAEASNALLKLILDHLTPEFELGDVLKRDCIKLLPFAVQDKKLATYCVMIIVRLSSKEALLASATSKILYDTNLEPLHLAVLARGILVSFPADDQVARVTVHILHNLSKEYILNTNLQNICLSGVDEWCKLSKTKLSYEYWIADGRSTTVALMDYVLDNWSETHRKARYHLESLLQSLLDVIHHFISTCASTSEEERTRLLNIRDDVARRLLCEFKTNVRAAVPTISYLVTKLGAQTIYNMHPEFLVHLLNCFNESSGSLNPCTKLVLQLREASQWESVVTTFLSQNATQIVGDILVPALVNAGVELESTNANLNLMIWSALRSMGYSIQYGQTYEKNPQSVTIPIETMKSYLSSADSMVAAVKLLMIPKKTSVPMTTEEYTLCQHVIRLVTKVTGNETKAALAQCLSKFLEWADDTLVTWYQKLLMGCIYPGAPVERTGFVMELVLSSIKARGVKYCDADVTFALIASLHTIFEGTKTAATSILMEFPSPLPGLTTRDQVNGLLDWVLKHMMSDKRASLDTTSSILRVLHKKYVEELGWVLFLGDDVGLVEELQPIVDVAMMNVAANLANCCERAERAYCVGAVLCDRQYRILSTGFSRELPGNTHAEECALAKLGDDAEKAHGGIMYTTMEPCSKRLSGNRDCTSRCIEGKIQRVVCGVAEPTKFVICEGTRLLREQGITVDYITDRGTVGRCMEPNMFLFENCGEWPSPEEPAFDYAKASLLQDFNRDLVCRHFFMQLFNARLFKAMHFVLRDIQSFGIAWRVIIEDLVTMMVTTVHATYDSEDCRGLSGRLDTNWMLVGHACILLESLVCHLPTESQTDQWVLSLAHVQSIGDWMIDALCRSKHQGSIGIAVSCFQNICAHLLQSSSASLAKFPEIWLDQYLLRRIQSNETDDIMLMRRSIGFAGMFLAIARAESRAAPHVLLHRMMQVILPESRESKHRSVITLNILKLLVEDAQLQDEMEAYLVDVLVRAIHGFASGSWQIRNSSMMVFAKVARRLKQPFQRHPRLQDEMRQDFERGVGVYPWLLLLANGEEFLNSVSFVKLVISCSGDSQGMIRQVAARALATIVPFTVMGSVFEDLCESTTVQNANTCHGRLLMLIALLESIERRALSPPENEKVFLNFLQDALKQFSHCSVIVDAIWKACASWIWDKSSEMTEWILRCSTSTRLRCSVDRNLIPSALRSNDCRVRIEALQILQPDEDYRSILIHTEGAYPPELKLRLKALQHGVTIESSEYVRRIYDRSVSGVIRSHALPAMTSLPDFDQYILKASDPGEIPDLRFTAVECLKGRELGSKESQLALLRLLQDENDTIREHACAVANVALGVNLNEALLLREYVKRLQQHDILPSRLINLQVDDTMMEHPLDLGLASAPMYHPEPDNVYCEPLVLYSMFDVQVTNMGAIQDLFHLQCMTKFPGGIAFHESLFLQLYAIARTDRAVAKHILGDRPMPLCLRQELYDTKVDNFLHYS